jgi:hypothetical protein
MHVSKIFVVVVVVIAAAFGVANAKFFPYVEPIDTDWGGLDEPQTISNAGMFAGVYGRLDAADDIDALSFEFEQPVNNWLIRPIVPVCGDYFEDFYPSVAVIGPGLDAPDSDLELPFELPEDMGAAVFMGSDEERPVIRSTEDNDGYIMEGYASTEYELDIPESGNYLVVVWDTAGGEGAYVLATGATHPSELNEEQIEQMEAGFELIQSGEWMGQECEE